LTKKRFEFPLRTVKAFEKDGTKHIVAVASDNKLDLYWEFFSPSALGDMVKNCNSVKENKPQEGLVDLMETHRETFGFGYADKGWLNHEITDDESDLYELYIDFALKEGHACGVELYDEIKNNQVVKQLSVGGYIEDWDDDTDWETMVLNDNEENEIEIQALKIKHFYLEHVAATPGGWAVNPRTRFEDIKSDDMGFMASIYKSLTDEETQKSIQDRRKNMKNDKDESTDTESNTKEITGYKKLREEITVELPIMIKKTMVKMFGEERTDKMADVEKAKQLIEELKGLELKEDEMKELNLSFTTESSEGDPDEGTEDTEDTPDIGGEIEKSLEPVMEIIKGIQEKMDENKDEEVIKGLKDEITGFTEKLEKALEDRDTVIEELKSKVEKMGKETQTSTDTPDGEDKIDKDKTGSDDEEEIVERTRDNMWEQ
jgi:hypothetical protein